MGTFTETSTHVGTEINADTFSVGWYGDFGKTFGRLRAVDSAKLVQRLAPVIGDRDQYERITT